MSGIIHAFMHSLLPRIIGIAALSLAFSVDGLTKNICETSASLVNPLTATHSSIKDNISAAIIQSGIGGTGIQNGGIGGTGNKEDGIGGTGGQASNNDGVGGTGNKEDGVGGTGYKADGIGGTGGQASNNDGIGGTGIMGIITGFASICVNGVKINYSPDTPVTIDGRSSTTQDLAVGQMVAVRANGTGDEVTARNIAVIHAVVGPVDSFNPETGKMQVLDQTIQVHDQGGLEYLQQTNNWVQVSGHRLSDGTIVASRIELSLPLEEARINGHVTQTDTTGFIVNGTRIEIDQQVRPKGIVPGAEISTSGQWNNASLQVQHVQVDPTDQLMDQVERVVIEGYAQPINSGEFNLGSQTFILEPDLQASVNLSDDIGQDRLIQASGQLDSSQSIVVERVESTTLSATFIPDLEIDNVLQSDGNIENDQDGSPELEKESNEEIETDENHDSSLDESDQDNIGEKSEDHSNSDHSLESIQHESEQSPDDASHLDSPEYEHEQMEQPEDSHSHDAIEMFDGSEEFDSFDGTNDHLDMPIDHDIFDGSHDHDIPHDLYDDMHNDWDFDRH